MSDGKKNQDAFIMDKVSKFLYTGCDGAVVCLESEKDVLRDSMGRPIIRSLGLIYGTQDDMIHQVIYVMERVKRYDTARGICTVIEGDHKSFRFPELRMKNVFDLLRFKYWKECEHGIIHFINLSFIHRIGAKFALKVLPEVLRSKVVIHECMSSFLKHIPVTSQLVVWGGNIDFDIDHYVTERCEEENVAKSVYKQDIRESQLKEATLALNEVANRKIKCQVYKKTSKGTWTKKLLVLDDDHLCILENSLCKYMFNLSDLKLSFHENNQHFSFETDTREFEFRTVKQKDYDFLKKKFEK